MKTAILTDSNCGIRACDVQGSDIFVLPMPFYIDDEVFYEDIDLTQEEFYERLEGDSKISTSMPVVGDVLDPKLYMAFELLEYALITSPGAPIKQALSDAGIGLDVGAHEIDRGRLDRKSVV